MNENERNLLTQANEGKTDALEAFVWDLNAISRELFDQAVSIGERTCNGCLLSGLSAAIENKLVEGGVDLNEYFRLSELASDYGDKYSSQQLGWDYLKLRNWEKAFHYFEKALKQGVSNADLAGDYGCHPLIPGNGDDQRWIQNDIGGTDDLCPETFPLDWWLFVLDRKPTPILEYLIGLWYWGDPVESENKFWGRNNSPNKVKALELFERSAAGGSPDSMLKLIGIYAKGEFSDSEKALKWFRELEDFGDGSENPFQESVDSWARELGVTTRQVQAWEEKAKDGYPEACVDVAIAYLLGEGAPKDLDKAFSYVEEAISNDYVEDGTMVDLDGNAVQSPLVRFHAAIDNAPKAERPELEKRLEDCYSKYEEAIRECANRNRRNPQQSEIE